MSRFQDGLWKSNNQDVKDLAIACSRLVCHPDRTDDELILVAEIADTLNNSEDLSERQFKTFTKLYQERIGKPLMHPMAGTYIPPDQNGHFKGALFEKELRRFGIVLAEFDPEDDWKDRPKSGLSTDEVLSYLNQGRGAVKRTLKEQKCPTFRQN